MVDRDSWGDRETEGEREGERRRKMVEVGVHMTLVLWPSCVHLLILHGTTAIN